jgi:hypothetical protein
MTLGFKFQLTVQEEGIFFLFILTLNVLMIVTCFEEVINLLKSADPPLASWNVKILSSTQLEHAGVGLFLIAYYVVSFLLKSRDLNKSVTNSPSQQAMGA